jgi:hypothetical protein
MLLPRLPFLPLLALLSLSLSLTLARAATIAPESAAFIIPLATHTQHAPRP